LPRRVRFVDCRAQLVVGDLVLRRAGDRVGQPSADAHLDQIRAVLDVLADTGPERVHAAHADAVEITRAAAHTEPRTGGDDARPLDAAFRDGVPHGDVGVGGGAEILHRGEACGQRRARIRRGRPGQRQVNVRVDQAGKQDGRRKLDARRAFGNRDVAARARRHDAAAADEHDGVVDQPAALDVDHAARDDGDIRRLRRQARHGPRRTRSPRQDRRTPTRTRARTALMGRTLGL
jgi:hypothetical protein